MRHSHLGSSDEPKDGKRPHYVSQTADGRTERGARGEAAVSALLQRHGFAVIELGRCDDPDGKPTQVPLHSNGDSMVTPDLLAFKALRCYGFEVKTKETATWHRNSQRWCVGLRQREHRRLQRLVAVMPIGLMYWLERDDTESGQTARGGAYYCDVTRLLANDPALISHRNDDTIYVRLGALRFLGGQGGNQ